MANVVRPRIQTNSMYTYYGGGRRSPYTVTPTTSPSGSLRRLTDKERKAVQRQREKNEAMMSASPGSMNRNLLKFVDEFERGSLKDPLDYDDAILELEAAVNRLLELRYEAQQKFDRRQQIAAKYKEKGEEHVKRNAERMKMGMHGYLDKMNTIAPFKDASVSAEPWKIDNQAPNPKLWTDYLEKKN